MHIHRIASTALGLLAMAPDERQRRAAAEVRQQLRLELAQRQAALRAAPLP